MAPPFIGLGVSYSTSKASSCILIPSALHFDALHTAAQARNPTLALFSKNSKKHTKDPQPRNTRISSYANAHNLARTTNQRPPPALSKRIPRHITRAGVPSANAARKHARGPKTARAATPTKKIARPPLLKRAAAPHALPRSAFERCVLAQCAGQLFSPNGPTVLEIRRFSRMAGFPAKQALPQKREKRTREAKGSRRGERHPHHHTTPLAHPSPHTTYTTQRRKGRRTQQRAIYWLVAGFDRPFSSTRHTFCVPEHEISGLKVQRLGT